MALFGQLSTPTKALPLIDLTSADIMMELLEEVAITASTADYIDQHEPHHPEAAEIHEQANDVYQDFLNILKGKVKDKRINRKSGYDPEDLREHFAKNEKDVEGDILEFTLKRFLAEFIRLSRLSMENHETMSRREYYAFMSGWAHYFAGLAPDETPPTDPTK